MVTVAITKASNYKFLHRENMPEEVYNYFLELAKKYDDDSFIVGLNPFDEHSDIEVMIYDDYVE